MIHLRAQPSRRVGLPMLHAVFDAVQRTGGKPFLCADIAKVAGYSLQTTQQAVGALHDARDLFLIGAGIKRRAIIPDIHRCPQAATSQQPISGAATSESVPAQHRKIAA